MEELARLIRRGLAQEGVQEQPLIRGAGEVNGTTEANVVGLALIGKWGAEVACQLFVSALIESLNSRRNGPGTIKILQQIGLKSPEQAEKLAALHVEKSAEQIAQILESGQIVL